MIGAVARQGKARPDTKFAMQFYKMLDVNPGCTKEEIRRSYKKLAIKHHPDKEGGDAEEFKRLGAAYAVLSDEDSRTRYDQLGDEGWKQHGAGTGGGPGPGHKQGMNPMDVFAQMFGGMSMGGGQHQQQTQMQRRVDHSHVLDISLRDAFHGVTRLLRVSLQSVCLSCTCDCGACQGVGHVTMMQANGMFHHIVRVRCEACSGNGYTLAPGQAAPCRECNDNKRASKRPTRY